MAFAKTPSAQGYIQVDGGKLYYQTFGAKTAAKRPVIVLHGGPGLDSSYLLPQMEALAKNNQPVTFYDQRGSGKSLGFVLDQQNISMAKFVQDLENVRKQLGYEKFVLVGHSWGALLAMNYAITYPDKLQGLVLADGAPSSSEEFKSFQVGFAKRLQPIQADLTKIKESEKFIAGDPITVEDYYRKLFSVYFYSPKYLPDLTLEFTRASALSGRKVVEILAKTYINNYDLAAQLKKLKVSTLIIHGQEDIVPVQMAINTHNLIHGSQLVVIPKCDHFPYIEQPDQFFAAIDKFIAQL